MVALVVALVVEEVDSQVAVAALVVVEPVETGEIVKLMQSSAELANKILL